MFQFLNPKVDPPLATFPRDQTEGHWGRPKRCPQDLKKRFITLPHLRPISSQHYPDPPPHVILPYITCNLHAIWVLGGFFLEHNPSVSELADSILNFSFLSKLQTPAHAFLWASACRQVDSRKNAGVPVTPLTLTL